MQGSGKDLIQPVLDNQLKAASPLLVPAKVTPRACSPYACISAAICVCCNAWGAMIEEHMTGPKVNKCSAA